MKKSIFFPELYIDCITDINEEYLKDNEIFGLIIDMDNTVLNYERYIVPGLKDWINRIKKFNVRPIILTNSWFVKRAKKIANELEIEYIAFACKPLSLGFNKAIKKLGLKRENVAVVGDQIFTDILGGNLLKMHTILVEPIFRNKESFITRILRFFEKPIIKKYKKEKK